jgi:hypothetical protein
VHDLAFELDGTMPAVDVSRVPLPTQARWKARVRTGRGHDAVYGYNDYRARSLALSREEDPGWYRVLSDQAHIDYLVTDAEGYSSFLEDRTVGAYHYADNVTGLDSEFLFPDDNDYYFVLSNKEQLNASSYLPVSVHLYSSDNLISVAEPRSVRLARASVAYGHTYDLRGRVAGRRQPGVGSGRHVRRGSGSMSVVVDRAGSQSRLRRRRGKR